MQQFCPLNREMKRVVFYSWQSDLPNGSNRGFIQDALEKAAAAIAADDTFEVEPVVDRDTQGVPGSPDIASTIFAKIADADVFVADISIIGRPQNGRPAPNPNVLIELGYAFKAIGHERVILVFNRAFGRMEELPFDLRMRRVVSYDMPEEASERAPERKKLEKVLDSAIRSAVENIPHAGKALSQGRAEISPELDLRVDAVNVSARFTHSGGDFFSFVLTNESRESVVVKEIRLFSVDQHPLAKPYVLPLNTRKDIAPEASLSVEARLNSNPAAALSALNWQRDRGNLQSIPVDFTISVGCEVLHKFKRYPTRVRATLDPVNNRVDQVWF